MSQSLLPKLGLVLKLEAAGLAMQAFMLLEQGRSVGGLADGLSLVSVVLFGPALLILIPLLAVLTPCVVWALLSGALNGQLERRQRLLAVLQILGAVLCFGLFRIQLGQARMRF